MSQPRICLIDASYFTDKEDLTEMNLDFNRPYLSLKITLDNNDYYIPFESELHTHPGLVDKALIILPYQTETKSFENAGINFEKTIIVNDPTYVIEEGSIKNNQFNEIVLKYDFILRQFTKYINDYKKCHDSEHLPFRFKFSSLKYFHDELGL